MLKISLILLCIIFSGCLFYGDSPKDQAHDERASLSTPSKYTKTLKYDFETTWSAVITSLDGSPLEKIDKENGMIRTGWIEGLSRKKSRGILTNKLLTDYERERYRMTIDIFGNDLASTVTARCQVQEKARGGSAAYRWERKRSTGKNEEEILTKIEDILNRKLKGF